MSEELIQLDFQRLERIGFDEAILCERKSAAQLEAILDKTLAENVSCLMTRLEADVHAKISDRHRDKIDYDSISRTGYFNWSPPSDPGVAQIAIVTAGSSDMPAAQEALRTLRYAGLAATPFIDVGVAGLWRLLRKLDDLKKFPVIIAVAGMDGALPSVLGGLVPGLIITVPTSTGYGASRNGETALSAALASCAPGLAVVNIDNGYGAACAAHRAINMIQRAVAQAK